MSSMYTNGDSQRWQSASTAWGCQCPQLGLPTGPEGVSVAQECRQRAESLTLFILTWAPRCRRHTVALPNLRSSHLLVPSPTSHTALVGATSAH